MNNVAFRIIDLSRPTKRLIQVAVDALLIIACFCAAMILRLESAAPLGNPEIWIALAPVLPVTIITLRGLSLYRSILRFITGQVFRAIGIGVLVSCACLVFMATLTSAPIPRSVPGIYALLLVLSLGGVRFLIRGLLRRPVVAGKTPVAIYGAGDAGRQLQNALFHGREYVPVAFIDDDRALHNTLVSGRRVFPASAISELVEHYKIEAVLLAMPNVSRVRKRQIIAQFEPTSVEIKTIPGMADIISGKATFDELRQVTPEDLLGRDPVPPRKDLMSRNITGKVVLVSGAGGSIGSEICRQIIQHDPAAIVLLDSSEIALYSITHELRDHAATTKTPVPIEPILGSVQNASRVSGILRAFGVETVYHAAAYKHVVHVEENVAEGIVNNVIGTRVLAEAAAAHGVADFILISTDKAVRPTNFMGASKRMAELVCQAMAARQSTTRFSMVRFGNVLGSSGSVIPRFRAQIEAGGPVTVTHPDITRYFMTIPEAAQLVIQAGAMAEGGDVFVLDMGEPVKILDLAQTMIRMHGLAPHILTENDPVNAAHDGDIAIRITGLNKGEKLYEELLIGNDPRGTDHPRIMAAKEVSLPWDALQPGLERLKHACETLDIPAIRQLFLEMPLAYQPNGPELHDLVWTAARKNGTAPAGALKVVGALDKET